MTSKKPIYKIYIHNDNADNHKLIEAAAKYGILVYESSVESDKYPILTLNGEALRINVSANGLILYAEKNNIDIEKTTIDSFTMPNHKPRNVESVNSLKPEYNKIEAEYAMMEEFGYSSQLGDGKDDEL